MEQRIAHSPYFILSLDGGGSLGVYTLGVLVEIERMLDCPLHEAFDLVYGTSTGSIIASMIALGDKVEGVIDKRYFEITPDVMGRFLSWGRSAALHRHAKAVYGDKTFEDFLIDIGIVATHLEYNRPMVFKRRVAQSHGSTNSFQPGFGVSIADAVIASCSAYPLFRQKIIETPNHGKRSVVDGGFTANSPALFALTDAIGLLSAPRENIRMLSIGTGSYPEKWRLVWKVFGTMSPTKTIMTLLRTSSNTVETLRKLLFGDVTTIRIDDAFTDSRYKTDFIESDPDMMKSVYQLGRQSFEKVEHDLRAFFKPGDYSN